MPTWSIRVTSIRALDPSPAAPAVPAPTRATLALGVARPAPTLVAAVCDQGA